MSERGDVFRARGQGVIYLGHGITLSYSLGMLLKKLLIFRRMLKENGNPLVMIYTRKKRKSLRQGITLFFGYYNFYTDYIDKCDRYAVQWRA